MATHPPHRHFESIAALSRHTVFLRARDAERLCGALHGGKKTARARVRQSLRALVARGTLSSVRFASARLPMDIPDRPFLVAPANARLAIPLRATEASLERERYGLAEPMACDALPSGYPYQLRHFEETHIYYRTSLNDHTAGGEDSFHAVLSEIWIWARWAVSGAYAADIHYRWISLLAVDYLRYAALYARFAQTDPEAFESWELAPLGSFTDDPIVTITRCGVRTRVLAALPNESTTCDEPVEVW